MDTPQACICLADRCSIQNPSNSWGTVTQAGLAVKHHPGATADFELCCGNLVIFLANLFHLPQERLGEDVHSPSQHKQRSKDQGF